MIVKDAHELSYVLLCGRPLGSYALNDAHRWSDVLQTIVMQGARAALFDICGGIALCT